MECYGARGRMSKQDGEGNNVHAAFCVMWCRQEWLGCADMEIYVDSDTD